MSTVRFNITLPEDVGEILAGVENKSAYIAEAIKEKKRMEEKEKMKSSWPRPTSRRHTKTTRHTRSGRTHSRTG